MENRTRGEIGRKRSLIVGALLLTAYGLLLFSLDPEWVMWSGSMTMGVLYLPELHPPVLEATRIAVRMAAFSGLLALLALGVLTGVVGEDRRD